MSVNPPPQFGIRSLLIVMTVVAVVCGLVACIGFTGLKGLGIVGVIFAGAAGAFIGLLICAYSGLGFGFEDIRWDAVKCFIVAAVSILTAIVLDAWAPVTRLQAISLLVMIVSMKLCWEDIDAFDMVIVGFCILAAAGIVAGIVTHWSNVLAGG